MTIDLKILEANGLTDVERQQLAELIDRFNYYSSRNALKRKFYEGHVTLGDVNLGIALPRDLRGLEIGCEWGAKTVDVLAGRSMFDGFVGENGQEAELMTQIIKDNQLIAEYAKACRDELEFGCTFATLAADPEIGCRIRFHSPQTAAAVWSGEKNRLDYGMAIIDIDRKKEQSGSASWAPTVINLYNYDAVWVLRKDQRGRWTAEENIHHMGRPLMEPLVWNATSAKPFGRSRLKKPVRELIKGYVRTVANATIGLEFSTAPQKYLLGLTDDQYDAVINDKFRAYVGSMIASTSNPETGEKPTFGQLPQGTIEPHVQMIRVLATQFSAATGLSVVDTGVINDANPSSSDAILAQSQTLVLMAEQLNKGNADHLYVISQMAQAIANNVAPEDLTDDEKNVMAHFRNPAMPSVSATTDAALKISTVRPAFAETDAFLEMIGFDQADIRRIRGQEAIVRGRDVLIDLTTETPETPEA